MTLHFILDFAVVQMSSRELEKKSTNTCMILVAEVSDRKENDTMLTCFLLKYEVQSPRKREIVERKTKVALFLRCQIIFLIFFNYKNASCSHELCFF